MKNLKVTAFTDAQGNKTIIKVSKKNPLFGSVMVKTISVVTTDSGAIFTQPRTGYVKAEVVNLQAMNLTEGCNFNENYIAWGKSMGANLLPRTIVIAESLTPAYQGQEPKINPTTKASILSAEGLPIYYNTKVPADNADAFDVLIPTIGASASVAVAASAEAFAQ